MTLNSHEKKILNFIREGRNSLADFTDNLGLPAPVVNKMAEQMEQQGYVVRASLTGISRFNWFLTDQGVAELDPLNADEIRLLSEGGINMNQYKILVYAKAHPKAKAGEICDKMRLNRNEMVSDLCYLVDRRLLKEVGIIRRKVMIASKGEETIKKFENCIRV
jgi:SSS family solute:Na+ symporter